MDCLELLSEVILLLIAVDLILYPFCNAALDGENLILFAQQGGQDFQTFADAGLFQNGLLVFQRESQILGQILADINRIFRTDNIDNQILRHFWCIIAVFFKQILHNAHIGIDGHLFGFLHRLHRHFFAHYLIKRIISNQLAHTGTVNTFHHYADNLALRFQNLFYLCHYTDGVQIFFFRMLDPAVFLCYQKDFLVALHRFIECKDGFLACHIKVEHHFWKHDQTTDRDRWQTQGLHFGHLNLFLGHSYHLSSSEERLSPKRAFLFLSICKS